MVGIRQVKYFYPPPCPTPPMALAAVRSKAGGSDVVDSLLIVSCFSYGVGCVWSFFVMEY